MPKQFIDAGFEPQADWTGYDVAMIWVGANLRLLDQLSKARGARVGRQIFDQIRWIEDPLAPTTVPRTGARAQAAHQLTPEAQAVADLAPVSPALLAARNEVDAARRGVAEVWERPIASNLWIAGPKKTTDGSTVLINGPQFNWFNPS